MIGLTRRQMLAGSMVLTPWYSPAPLSARQPLPTEAALIYDSRFPAARRFASQWAGKRKLLIDTQLDDLAQAWRSVLPDAVKRGGVVAGLTLWSDQYISAQFAHDLGLKQSQIAVGDDGLCLWVLIEASSSGL